MANVTTDGNTTKDETGEQYVYDAWDNVVDVEDSSDTVIASYQENALNGEFIQ